MQAEHIFAKVVSYIFHPLLLPTMGLFLIFHLNGVGLWIPAPQTQLLLFAITFLATGVMPLLSALLLYKMKLINSLEMQTKEERRLPYLVSAIFYSCESYLLIHADVSGLTNRFMLGATVLVISTLIINTFWKISAHMVGIGGICGILLAVSFRLQLDIHMTLIALFLLAGFVAFSRLKLSAHDPAQVYIGFLLGVFVQLVLFL